MRGSSKDLETGRISVLSEKLTNVSIKEKHKSGLNLSALVQNPLRSSVDHNLKEKRFMTAHSSILRKDDRALLTWDKISFFVPLTLAENAQNRKSEFQRRVMNINQSLTSSFSSTFARTKTGGSQANNP